MNYAINGIQCAAMTESSDDHHWGRVEVVSKSRHARSTLLDLLYVTDRGQTKPAPASRRIDGEGCVGMTFGDIAAIFATSREGATEPLSIALDAPCRVFVSGLAEGSWSASLDGKAIATASVSPESGLAVIELPEAGVLTLTRV
jgi:hypothetical protein